MKQRVVITGMGAVTPVGSTLPLFWANIQAGKSGLGPVTRFECKDYVCRIAAELKDFNPEAFLDRKDISKMDLFVQYAYAAAHMAFKDSGLNMEQEDRDRAGVIIGSGIGGLCTLEEQHTRLMAKGPRGVSPFLIPKLITDMASGEISIRLGMKGPNYCTVSACASGAHAIADSFYLIQRGGADIVVTGGTEATITPLALSGFGNMRALSTRNDDPVGASRPFDKNRDGFVMGEGAGVIILETLEHAQRRGTKIYAEIIGAGMTGDAYHITQPEPSGDGASRAMKLSLADAGIRPTDVEYINAHGTSTPFNDKTETLAIKRVFGEHAYKLNISSTKSMTGHMLGAGGAVEFIITCLGLQEGKIPPTINYQEPDPECDLNYTPNTMIHKPITFAISNSLGFGGHNITLVAKKY
jgi:3-oxoacyl-[acyl-carrier-protein] synthase II